MQGEQTVVTRVQALFAEELARDLALISSVVAVLSFLGPFGTDTDLNTLERIIYWSVSVSAGYGGGSFYTTALKPALLRRKLQRIGPLVGAVVISTPASISVFVLEAVLRVPIPWAYAFTVLSAVFVVSLAVWGVFVLGASARQETPQEDPAFLDFQSRWPAALRGSELLALSAEDHYVRIRTTAGEALLHSPFGQSLEAVKNVPGTRVHRSWWVAAGAPTQLVRGGGKWILKLSNVDVPVSRRYRPEVRAQGWDKLGTK